MLEQESYKAEMQSHVYYKFLRLVRPEDAQKLGIPAECPVFVSPFVTGAQQPCQECGECFTPLVYQTGHRIQAQHFCENYGGIYFNSFQPRQTQEPYLSDWIATLTPVGGMTRINELRAPAVRIDRIGNKRSIFRAFINNDFNCKR